MKSGAVGRADLLEAYLAGGLALQRMVARQLGLEPEEPEAEEVPPGAPPVLLTTTPDEETPPAETTVVEAVPVPFWCAESFASLRPLDESPLPPLLRAPSAGRREFPLPEPLAFRPLAAPGSVRTKLRGTSSMVRTGRDIHLPRLVDELGRGRFPRRLPLRQRRAWGRAIHIVVDRQGHLKPYRQDQDAAVEVLRGIYARDGVQVAELREGAMRPQSRGAPLSAPDFWPESGTTVLALSDLGALAIERPDLRSTWLALGRRYREGGIRPIALVPCDVGCVPRALFRDWEVVPWESRSRSRRAGIAPEQVEEVAGRILTLLSHALRLEPALVREVRRLLVKGRLGAGLEARVWQDTALKGRHFQAAELHPSEAKRLQERFGKESKELRRQAVQLLHRCHRAEFPELWFLERLSLEEEWTKLDLPDSDLPEALRWVDEQRQRIQDDPRAQDPDSPLSLWFRRAFLRIPNHPLHGSAGDELHQIWGLTSAEEDAPPNALDPAKVPALDQPIRLLELVHFADRLIARPFGITGDAERPTGSPLGLIRTRNGLIKVEPPDDFWEGVPPKWASDWGRDQYGAWVEFGVDDIVQRMRWIPPGRFLMGTPEGELTRARYQTEQRAQHEETIEPGFWMFNTPVTQSLWQVVMGRNESHFDGSDRPVDCVYREDCREFIARLNDRVIGLGLALPDENQWEYACRSGTVSPRYHENLDEIAWHLGNSDRQTHPVGRKAPNDWGLYDTLGNVWEWCADTFFDEDTYVFGVARGGSWLSDAEVVHASYRNVEPTTYFHLGFRCAEFNAPGPVASTTLAERTGSESERGTEPRGNRASWLRPGAHVAELESEPITTLTPMCIQTDLETLTVCSLIIPTWASAVGRDRYGLWAEIAIEPATSDQSRIVNRRERKTRATRHKPELVRQRLRWIPPGRFLMGSPQDEDGRWDTELLPNEVTITTGFWIFDTPCTQVLWDAVMGEDRNPSHFKEAGAERPVEQVNWDECRSFVRRLNQRLEGLLLGLPSEAQWEYDCRAGSTSARYREDPDTIAWYRENSDQETHAVGQKVPNAWGLYDMLGNVWEWCADAWHREDGDMRSADVSARRVVRGSSWQFTEWFLRAGCQNKCVETERGSDLGFRCAQFRNGMRAR